MVAKKVPGRLRSHIRRAESAQMGLGCTSHSGRSFREVMRNPEHIFLDSMRRLRVHTLAAKLMGTQPDHSHRHQQDLALPKVP